MARVRLPFSMFLPVERWFLVFRRMEMSGSPRTSPNQMKSDKFEGRPRKLLARKIFLIFCWPRLERRWEDCQLFNFPYKKLVRRIGSDKRIQIQVHNLFIGAEATQHEEKKRRDQNQSGLFSGHQWNLKANPTSLLAPDLLYAIKIQRNSASGEKWQ